MSYLFIFIWFLALSLFMGLVGFFYFYRLLEATKFVKKNFKGKFVPTSGGILLVLSLIGVVSITSVLNTIIFLSSFTRLKGWLLFFFVLVIGVGFLGLVDDFLGSREVGSFKGHFGELAAGNLTTGVVKAIGTGLVSLYVASAFSRNLPLLILNSLILVFCVNVFNLLDLRPGRAIKVFLVSGLLAFLFSFRSSFWALWGTILGIVLVLFYVDLKQQLMIGDVGSNILGAIIGFSLMVNFGWVAKLVVVVLLFGVQLLAEKYSITELISKIGPLKWLDELGREPG